MDVAIIGVAARFPGANNVAEFWDNLKLGVEAIRFYSEEEVIASGIFPEMARDPDFVPAAGGIDHEFDFDAEFFGFNPVKRRSRIPSSGSRWSARGRPWSPPDTTPRRPTRASACTRASASTRTSCSIWLRTARCSTPSGPSR
jgi:hypothetical protein